MFPAMESATKAATSACVHMKTDVATTAVALWKGWVLKERGALGSMLTCLGRRALKDALLGHQDRDP